LLRVNYLFALDLKRENVILADRGTDINAAYEYLLSVADASDNPPAVITAAHVLMNTVCNALLMDEVQHETV
jgi:hypothetical protein